MLMIFTYIFSRSFLFVLHSRTCTVVFSTFMHLRPGPRLSMGCCPSTRRAAHGLARSLRGLSEFKPLDLENCSCLASRFIFRVLGLISGVLLRPCTTAFQVRTVGPDGDSKNLAILNTGFSSPYGSLTNDLQ